MAQVHFTISGEFITEHARSHVLSGKWKKGINFLKESIPELPLEYIESILKGESKLVGDNEVFYEKESPEVTEEYKKDVNFIYLAGRLEHKDKKYKAYGYVYYATEEDADNIYKSMLHNKDSLRYNNWSQELGVLYMNDKYKDECFVMRLPNQQDKVVSVLFELDTDNKDTPYWLEIATTPEDAFKYGGYIENVGYTPKNKKEDITLRINENPEKDFITNNLSLIENKEDNKPSYESNIRSDRNEQEPDYSEKSQEDSMRYVINNYYGMTLDEYAKDIREKIFNKAKEVGMNFDTYVFEKEINGVPIKLELEYPEEVMLNYVLSRSHLYNLMNKWDCFSENSLKMQNDNTYHTEAWIACGLPLDWTVYSHNHINNSAFYALCSHVQKKLLNYDVQILNSADKFKVSGTIRTPETFSEREENESTILLVKSASPEYVTFLPKIEGIICETGGKLAHLVIVGRENGVPIVRQDNALEKYVNGFDVTIDLNKSTIKMVADYTLEIFEVDEVETKVAKKMK